MGLVFFASPPFSYSQSAATPSVTPTPGPESLLPPDAKILKAQWGYFRGKKTQEVLFLTRTKDSKIQTDVIARSKNHFFVLWEQIYQSRGQMDPNSGAYVLDTASKIPSLIIAPYMGADLGGQAYLYQWNGKTFEKISGAEVPMESMEIQDLKGDKRLELICTERYGDDRIFGIQKGSLADESADFPDYYQRPAGRYYPEKEILFGSDRLNRFDIYMTGYDSSGKALLIPKPAARLWLMNTATNKDLSINITRFQVHGTTFSAGMTDPSFGSLSIDGKFLDKKFSFKAHPPANKTVLKCNVRFTGSDQTKHTFTDARFIY